ncbi:glycosyltransferase family 2 protein [Sphingomonas sp.]|uniref:glycosyltransferase family 2 protein n=1 Tax=Sphingomonas sp. TaxID=28214 RepID=UPI0025CF4B27|nr:glycosyltransferase family 2 protein [Sphingomonas sp.]
MQPRVSVVISFYNGAAFIREAIASVVAQSLSEWELVLVDDGSTDSSAVIAKDFVAADRRARYVTHPGRANRGLAASRVLGSDTASGLYLLFLDHDDILDPEALERLAGLLEAHPRAAAVLAATRFWTWDASGSSRRRVQSYRPLRSGMVQGRKFLRYLVLSDDHHPHVCSMMFRRKEFIAARDTASTWHGMYEDTALLVKLLAKEDVYLLDEPVSDYRITSNSMSFTSPRRYSAFLRWTREVPLDARSRAVVIRRLVSFELMRFLSGLRRRVAPSRAARTYVHEAK